MAPKETRYRRMDVRTEHDVWLVIGVGTSMAQELGLMEADCTRVETVISELAHNVLLHGGGGTVTIDPVSRDKRFGIRICARDSGPGITDVSRALEDGFTTRDSLGIGLGVTKRMMDDVAIRSHPGWGTVVTVTKWASNGC
jgi:serine/threonine-protein kinase RsbT